MMLVVKMLMLLLLMLDWTLRARRAELATVALVQHRQRHDDDESKIKCERMELESTIGSRSLTD